MDRERLLKLIAETGYDVGFGAKKHFATYDIVEKVPGAIGFFSIAIGIYGLVWERISGKMLAATLAVAGVIGLYISFYDRDKARYESVGRELTIIVNELRTLYRETQATQGPDLPVQVEAEYRRLEQRFYAISISKQILFSDWYAHYKFFWQHQIQWIEEQKRFTFLRDKVPLSFSLSLAVCVLLVGVLLVRAVLSHAC